MMRWISQAVSMFQFTHPGRGATLDEVYLRLIFSFNSRTPGGVRPVDLFVGYTVSRVSIHAPREGCD